jgi:hypothetical protein
MNLPGRKAPGELGSKAGRELIDQAHYAVLSFLANVSGAILWFVEQRRWRLADRIEDERSAQ